LSKSKVADNPIQRHDSQIRRQILAIPDNAWGGWGGRGNSASGPNYFTQSLGGWSREPRQPVIQHRGFYQ
jgi:hypothetical protein